ncbi:MAG: ADP-ribosylglycohydrolase family protein, partial [Lachnospiraceae bacterium]|nr:ADP-ribosylglycohydrolase family protein [Lachnospiraceae bacterium]
GTVEALKAWIKETGAVEKQYIGPSSLKALEKIDGGMPAAQAGLGGTTCGGIMRTPAAVLWKQDQTREELADSIQRSLLPTHNSSEAWRLPAPMALPLRRPWKEEAFWRFWRLPGRGAPA